MSVDLLEVPAAPEVARPPRTPWLADRLRQRLGGLPRRWADGWSMWWNRPWTNERIAQLFTAIVVVGLSTFAVVQVVHLDLVFTDNTPTGGDFGAHVMGPAYLRDHLLSQGKITGWTNGWYAGTPMYRFYMVVPALLIVFLNVFMPYGVAMKVVSVLGVLTLPACCWLFGRLARFRWPMPELFALAGMIFLFDESFSIYGGNMKSTMAGEFSFSIALSLAMLGLGLFARGLETGQYKGWSAVVLALAMLSHGIVLIFVALGMLLLWFLWVDKTRFFHGIAVGGTALLLSAFWVLPFVFNHDYMTDMKYEPRPKASNDSFWYMFFPWPSVFDFIVTSLAIVGFVACVARRHLNGAWLGIVCLALTSLVFVTKDHELPFLGLLWNPRLLPFLYLLRLMLMMVGIVELVRLGVRGWYGVRGVSDGVHLVSGIVTAAVVLVVVMVIELFVFEEMPGGHYATKNGQRTYSWGIGGWDIVSLSPKKKDANSDGWTAYNFGGYEGRPHYNEYRDIVLTMKDIGEDPDHGCGRAIWENNDDVGPYGTTMALMLLPHWTDECIASMEGLYFEASGTTPFHFVTSAAVSSEGSKPVREQRYDDSDIVRGVSYMRALGVNYLMVHSQVAKDQAAGSADLTLIAESGPWQVYEVSGSELVEPLPVQPVVVLPRDSDHRPGDQRERHLELGMSWFRYREDWMAMPADGGPNTWQRIHVDPVIELREYEADSEPGDIKLRHIDVVRPRETIEPVPLPEVNVSAVDLQNESLRFDVDRVGVPVVVKLSYFPNWKATGAEGPYRIGPNMMVVVPTSNTVTLNFERSTLDNAAYALTLLGVLCLVAMWLYGPTRHRSPYPALLRFDDDPAADHDDDAQRGYLPVPDATVPITRPDPDDPFDDAVDDPFDDAVDDAVDTRSDDLAEDRLASPRLAWTTVMTSPDSGVLDAIFKAYDVRGTVPEQLNDDVAYALGVAFATFCGGERVLVGRDMRPSGPQFVEAFARGANEQGSDVVDLGLASTDLVYFAAGALDSPAAIFTASHNPAQYNGVKFCLSGARAVGLDSGLDQVRELARAVLDGRRPVPAHTPGRVTQRNMLESFADHVLSFIDVDALQPMRVVADTANGMGGLVVPAVYERLPQVTLEVMYGELDGTFPNHPADPLQPANQRDLQARVVAGGFDVGLAFDGDADRVFLVDETGRGLSGSTTTAILAAATLRANPGATILHNLICSKAVPEVITELGGTPVRTKVGHSFIKQVMASTGAMFGGEHSAHYYFARNYRADSGLIASLLVLEEVSRSGTDLSVLRKPYERYSSSGEINTQVADTAAVIEAVSAHFADVPQDRLDGLTVDHGSWWFNLRPSNTEPLLRLNLEAADRDSCDEHVAELLGLITSA